MSQKKKAKKQKYSSQSIENEIEIFPSEQIYIVWVNPNNGIPDIYGVFSTEENANEVITRQLQDRPVDDMQFSTTVHIIDHRLKQPQIKYWRPKTKDHEDIFYDDRPIAPDDTAQNNVSAPPVQNPRYEGWHK
jgi:hypothetical protein